MELEDERRFEVYAAGWNYGGATLCIACKRCDWRWESDCPDGGGGEVTLADLDLRADEHTEVCR
jgi:hypothetical protein